MYLRHPLILAAATLFLSFATVATFEAYGILGLILLMATAVFIIVSILVTFHFRGELVDEMEVGVVFNRYNNSFCRFEISPEPTGDPNCNNHNTASWLPFGRKLLTYNDPYFVRLKWHETFHEVKIPKKSQTASGTLKDVRTLDGVPVTIDWKVSYTVDVKLITPDINLEHKMARALPEHSEKIVTGRVERSIKHLLETQTIQSLYGLRAIQELEQEVAQRAYRQLSHPVNLGFKEIKAKDVSLGPISVPPKVEKALELAHQRKIQAEMVSGALKRLKLAIKDFSEEDMRRLAELERLRILDDKEAGLLYLSDAFVRNESVKVKQKLNGRSPARN